MKFQALFSLIKMKMQSAVIVTGTLRVKKIFLVNEMNREFEDMLQKNP